MGEPWNPALCHPRHAAPLVGRTRSEGRLHQYLQPFMRGLRFLTLDNLDLTNCHWHSGNY